MFSILLSSLNLADGLAVIAGDDGLDRKSQDAKLLDNRPDFELTMQVIDCFRIKPQQVEAIKNEVCLSVSRWASVAKEIAIGRAHG